ncbi:aldehyde dehydrogenase family protein [Acidisoma cellulosilytica]|uniref:Aldehyde dehydrogenase family protein n=1 Tax=Acidisoma cellulosilyticum TaxID=2802395 RepID=A0A963Z409_9PROT|nr:aldehyde dehydrogenase family protein [Acidisoma cellulosilyticum]MCB8882409.1 aldehyde dehydrogenase family protein [Acidisoma cellulosilyticum]
MTSDYTKFYIDGAFVDPIEARPLGVVNPATEQVFATISLGSSQDVDRAVAAARAAFETFSLTTRDERLAMLERMLEIYKSRYEDMAQAISAEMGSPIARARDSQAFAGQGHLEALIESFKSFEYDETRGTTVVTHEPVGVVALITPWNWPMNQIMCKVAPALAAGCTMVLKPSEIAPISGMVFAEIMHEAGIPKGVFNLVNGTGPEVGAAMSAHPGIDMVSFTGSTRAGTDVARNAAATVKRVAQELGGKSANIILPDADLEQAVSQGVLGCFGNTGQSCDAPTRMLVPAHLHDAALEIARNTALGVVTGDPRDEATELGPLVSDMQFNKVQALIESGIAEGATLVVGGPGKPDGMNAGYFVKPTVFGNVQPGMRIEREEIFGPVLSIIPYETVEQAITIANDTPYGLAAYVQGKDKAEAHRVARRLRAGSVYLNYPDWDLFAPFGGYKQSGNGREYADFGLRDFMEIKGIVC